MKVDTQPIVPEISAQHTQIAQSKEADTTAIPLVERSKEIQSSSNVYDKLENDDKKSVELDRDQLEAMAQKLQEFVGSLNRGLEFSVHEDSGRDVIKVIDKNSGDTVRQYPSEEVLDLVASLSDAAGNFVNIQA